MFRSFLVALGSSAVLFLCTASGSAQATRAWSTISSTPAVVQLHQGDEHVAGDEHVTVPVSYRCTNNARWTHYVSATVSRGFDPEALFVYGHRNAGGIRAANCTGQRVSESLTFLRSEHDGATPVSEGRGGLSFSLERRGATGVGAGWYNVHSVLNLSRGVTLTEADQ